jgi:4-hydroxybenzoate polyprenyltransferase
VCLRWAKCTRDPEPVKCTCPNSVALCAAFASGMGACQVASGAALGAGPLFFAGSAASIAHVMWQIRDVKLDEPADCLAKFKSNFTTGGILFTGIVADKLSL